MAVENPVAFASPTEWSNWLARNHAIEQSLWMKLYRKSSAATSITWEQAVIEALAYGWIDGVKNAGDETHWFQRFTPRRAKSVWSKKNTTHVEKLIAEGRMHPAGLAKVEAARADGRWDAAYSGGKTSEIPQDFLDLVAQDIAALATYQTLNAANRYAIYYRLTSAKKPETRTKRMGEILAKLTAGERIL